jgi:hypothetical protein
VLTSDSVLDMTTQPDERGQASGFSVEEDPDGGFRWSAFGPDGRREGRAESRSEAEAAAQAAEQELNRPDAPPTG